MRKKEEYNINIVYLHVEDNTDGSLAAEVIWLFNRMRENQNKRSMDYN